MALRNPFLAATGAIRTFQITSQCIRTYASSASKRPIPSPTPFVPDVETFLKLIGRNMSKYASQLSSWDQLFTASTQDLAELGMVPEERRYLFRRRENFRKGMYGPGGDLDHVVDGVSQLRVVEVPLDTAKQSKGNATLSARAVSFSATQSPGMRRIVVNLPPGATEYKYDPSKPLKKYRGMKVHNGFMIKGPHLQPIMGSKGSAALIKAEEGMWEHRKGRKVDGGERRRDEVRAKKRRQESKARAG